MYTKVIATQNVSERYRLLNRKEMVSGASYSIVQEHIDNKDNPIYIERFHEDEYIYIFPNFAKDGLIFRDQAMMTEYSGYIEYLRASGKSSSYIHSINFDNFSIDIDSINIYPGVYIFVYDSSVPTHLRTLGVSLTDNPMEVSSFSKENLTAELRRLGVTYLTSSGSKYEEDAISEVLVKEGGVGDRHIVNGDNFNKMINSIGLGLSAIKDIDAKIEEVQLIMRNEINDLSASFEASTSSITSSIANINSTIDSYSEQIASLTASINNLVQQYPYVIEQASSNPTTAREQLVKRNQYSNLLSQKAA